MRNQLQIRESACVTGGTLVLLECVDSDVEAKFGDMTIVKLDVDDEILWIIEPDDIWTWKIKTEPDPFVAMAKNDDDSETYFVWTWSGHRYLLDTTTGLATWLSWEK